jgi:hypothetical protein
LRKVAWISPSSHPPTAEFGYAISAHPHMWKSGIWLNQSIENPPL